MAVQLLIFDLDDTLIRTGDLEQRFRGQQFLGRQSQQYVDSLRTSFNQDPGRIVYSAFTIASLRARFSEARIGVFTRSPKHYAETLLNLAYPGLAWDFLIAFEDTPQPKPSGEGIRRLMERFAIPDPQGVWMVGDSPVDIRAAYDAGCQVILDTTTWPRIPAPRRRDDWKALERMPDAIIDAPEDLVTTLSSHVSYLPVAERLQQTACAPIPNRYPFARLEKFGAFDHEGTKHEIHYLGRHFSTQAQHRASWHQVTNDIHAMKNALIVPDYWVVAIGAFLQNLVRRNPHLIIGNSLVVTVVPAKPGRTRRLEAMLAQLSTVHAQRALVNAKVSFTPDLMRYRDGVLSHHGEGLTKLQRIENVMNHLEVIAGSGYENKHVVVIDDVATTGASLVYARKYLMAAGARQVTCLSLTKAINTQ
ncbi:HAD family hydrolase [Pseudomonas sp. 91RF]|jgi:phosphoglycolate phosphatase-like HAD superfamily hydrolase|uniref:HAD hydrolase-like protein n=1 Tax=Pseudomonas sp. 91RF TaxID=2292261 RepID=UPI000E664AED|nr:HAD hydrolase-like protein [Pseudomonas sp. 91RF]RIJ09704.1 HAD family hydrolase [Pseudomonas sp. 91RF]